MMAESLLKHTKVIIWPSVFAVIKAKNYMPGAFAMISDRQELTVIIDENKIVIDQVIESSRNWKLLTFDTVLPLEMVGFWALISSVLAQAGVSMIAVSSFSTDHILVKQRELDSATRQLADYGCTIDLRNFE